MKRRITILGAALALLVVALIYGSVLSSVGGVEQAVNAGDLDNLLEVVSLVRSRFYKPVEVADLLSAYARTGSIRGCWRKHWKIHIHG